MFKRFITAALLAGITTTALAEGPSGIYGGAGIGIGQLRQVVHVHAETVKGRNHARAGDARAGNV
jgi:hypothetical protein